MSPVAVIDVGSNSIKYFLGTMNPDGTLGTLCDQNDIARLGEGLRETRAIAPEAMARNAAAIARFAAHARENGATRIECVGTMALRNAKNTADFIELVKKEAGLTLRVISGDEEARLAYLAVLSGLGTEGDVVVFDTGGGSTEFVFGSGPAVRKRFSVDLGAIRITEIYFAGDPVAPGSVEAALADITNVFADCGVAAEGVQVVGIGGTVTSMGAVMHKMTAYDPDVIQGSRMTREEIEAQIADYSKKTLAQRREIIGLQPKRADVILAGACILKAILSCLKAEYVTISDRGLRHGMAYEILKEAVQ